PDLSELLHDRAEIPTVERGPTRGVPVDPQHVVGLGQLAHHMVLAGGVEEVVVRQANNRSADHQSCSRCGAVSPARSARPPFVPAAAAAHPPAVRAAPRRPSDGTADFCPRMNCCPHSSSISRDQSTESRRRRPHWCAPHSRRTCPTSSRELTYPS